MTNEAIGTAFAVDKSLVIIKTRLNKLTTTCESLASCDCDCDCDYFDTRLRDDWPIETDKKGRPKWFLDVDSDVSKDTLLRMQSGVLSVPQSFDEDFVQEQRRQLRFLCHRPTLTGASMPPGFVHIQAGLTRECKIGQRQVNFFARPFWCQATAVTQREWQALMGTNPSRF